MNSAFNPDLFLAATTTEASTKRLPIPAGRDLTGVIGDLKPRQWQGKKDPTQSGIAVDVPIRIDLTQYPELREQIGADFVTLTDGIMLDTTEAGTIDFSPGKNAKLRRYREALGMNQPGTPFSLIAMQGRFIKVKIKHETYEGEIYDKIDSVAKA